MLVFAGLFASTAQAAPSYCTAMFGVVDSTNNGTGVKSLGIFNVSTSRWVTYTALTGNANALSGANNNGLLYLVDRNTQTLYSVNPNQSPMVTTTVGVVTTPTASIDFDSAGGGTFQLIGATSDPAGNLFLMGAATQSTGNPNTASYVAVAQVNPASGALITSWTQLRTLSGGSFVTPSFAASGDIFFNSVGQSYMLSNTNQPTFAQIDLNPGSSFGQVTSPSTVITGPGVGLAWGGGAVDPLTGNVYISTASSGNIGWLLNMGTGVATLVDSTTGYSLTDQGNCTTPIPDPPTVSKSFNPTSGTAAFSTTTLTITLGNTNLAPIWLNTTFKDVLPSNMRVTNTSVLTSQGCASVSGNTVTATIATNTISFIVGGKIPAGGCTISVVVQATVTGAYVNTIPAGTLSTTAGTNTYAASAAFLVSTRDFSVSKMQRAGSSGVFTEALVSIPAGGTLQYQLTITNNANSNSAGTMTFTDTLSALLTPVLSVTVTTQTAAGSCVTTTSVATGQTTIKGTYTAASPGATCIVLVTVRGSSTVAASTSLVNSVTLGGVGDSSLANNTDTVSTQINPAANLSIFKTNNVTTVTASTSTSYTITVVNSGPAAATNAMVTDPAVTGLSCSTVSCPASSLQGGAACPTVAQTSIINLQGVGIPVPTFPANSTVQFVVGCTVTATGS